MIAAVPFHTLLKLAKGAIALRDRLFAVKICKFLKAFHDGTVGQDELANFLTKLENDSAYVDSITKITLYQIEAFNDDFKSTVLAELLKAHVRSEIDYPTYQSLAFSTTSVHPTGFRMIRKSMRIPRRGWIL